MNDRFTQLPFIPILFLVIFTLGLRSNENRTESTLKIFTPEQNLKFERSELLKRKDIEEIQVSDNPTYPGQTIVYFAIPASHLFKEIEIPKGSIIQFHCQDGFSGPIESERLLNESQKGSIAYLAIEMENNKWPPVDPLKSDVSAGPFSLIWKNSKASNIKQEEWPFQIVNFEVKSSIRDSFPDLFPPTKELQKLPVSRGLKVFTKMCFSCHTLNLEGESNFGPDLNIPFNPTEYLTTTAIRTLVRNPQDLRSWKNGRMKGFSETQLPNSDVDDLLAYLKVISKYKKSSKTENLKK